MAFLQKLGDTASMELTSADPNGALDEMIQRGLSLYSVYSTNELVTVFTVKRSEIPVLQSIIDSRGDQVRLVRESGSKIFLTRMSRRPVLLLGLVLILFLTVYLPSRLLLFRVEGNDALSASQILEEVYGQGIGFWSRRKDVRSEDIKNELISRIPQIAWAGINTKGCVATVSIRERDLDEIRDSTAPGSIYASRDGIISTVTASKGTALCAPGDAVLKGQLLISGFTDCGNIVLSEAAEGEVYAYTSRTCRAILPAYRDIQRPSGRIRNRFSLVIGKKRINFWKGSGISPIGCDRMYQEYWLKLPGGGVLPVCFIRETIIYQELEASRSGYDGTDLSDASEMYVHQQIPGGKILHREISFTETEDLLIQDGKFGCLEMIGKKIVEQIGENIWQER